MSTGFKFLPQGGGSDPNAVGSIQIMRTTTDLQNTQNDGNETTVFTFTGAANTQYYFEVFLKMHADSATASIAHRPSYDGDVTAVYSTVGGAQVSNQNVTSQPPTDAQQLGVSLTANAGDFAPGMLFASVDFGASGGTFTYAFRGGNSATPTEVLTGSFMRITKIL